MTIPEHRNRFLRDVIIVAGHELVDSMRTKRAIMMMVLFCGITVFFTIMFTSFLISMEREALNVLGLEPGPTGSATSVLWNNVHFQNIIIHLMRDDREAGMMLLKYSPLGVFYGLLMISLVPWLVALTSSARITEEVWGGAARFVLCRTTRFAWIIGKFIGQSLQLLVALLLTILAAWITTWCRLESFDTLPALRDMLIFAPKAWIYGLAFLGLVSGISMFCKTPGIANVLGIVGFLVVTALYYTARHYAGDGWRQVFDAIQILLPQHHYFPLMYPDWEHTLPASLFLLVLGLAYLFVGYARFARKDL